MIPDLVVVLSLAAAVAFLSVVARRLRVAPSILMLLAGVALAFVPGLPSVILEPDLVLLLLLPPLLYFSGVSMSWRGFCANLRPILLLAIGCVLFTAAAVAAVAHFALGLSWPVGFVLGAIISPPDAVAPIALLRNLRLPRRLITILEGESLVNDATALVAFSFALGAVATGTFSPAAASAKFAIIVIGELGYGLAAAWCMLRLRHYARDPRAEVLLALATPFVAFWPPHEIGGSGVIACVAAGLYVSWNGRKIIRPATRLQGFFIWDLVTWAIEALVFLLMGLQARAIAGNLSAAGWLEFLQAGALIAVATIVVRFVWVYSGTYLPRLLPALRRREPDPDWRLPFMVGFTGLRGVVSLAAALSIPLAIDGRPFPDRDLVLFVTFFVIVATLVGLGSVLAWIARRIGLDEAGRGEAVKAKRDERAARLKGIRAVLKEIERAETEGQPAISVAALRRYHADRLVLLTATADETTMEEPTTDAARLQLRLIAAERSAITRLYEDSRVTDEARRRIERELDLEEARSQHAEESASSSDGSDLARRERG
ncbi:MAG TPA: Na+/H+ antiporter [Dongiaceae bacterium]|jgi:CPA1 family monovalent cation:H+ antiporter|nr:Na+/H+ antiporter [Dongiaceae bacterium]